MISTLVFLLAMPLTVYALAGCLQVIDQVSAAGRFSALLSLSFRIVLIALLALAAPAASQIWILFGALAALAFNISLSYLARYVIRSGRWPTDRIE